MSNHELAYEILNGSLVEIKLENITYRGDLNVQLTESTVRNPATDKVVLDQPVELPSGKKHTTEITFPVLDIKHIELIEVGLFKKRNVDYEINPVSPAGSHGSGKSKKSTKSKGKLTNEAKDLEPIEIQLKTFMVKEPLQLKVFTKIIKEVDVCGISLEGQNVGRKGTVSWIILTAGKTLIPFDVDSLCAKLPDFWKTFEKHVFINEKLVKIIHDGRATADYLWHVHGIKMLNVFDTQVADEFIAKEHTGCELSQPNPLSDCLQMYNRRIPLEELDFLRKYEIQNFACDSPFLMKPLPPPELLKLCAIKVKHLVPLRENMMSKLMERFNQHVEAHLSTYRDRPDNSSPVQASAPTTPISKGIFEPRPY